MKPSIARALLILSAMLVIILCWQYCLGCARTIEKSSAAHKSGLEIDYDSSGPDNDSNDLCVRVPNPLPGDQCDIVCSEANWQMARDCLGAPDNFADFLSSCMTMCIAGCLPDVAADCFNQCDDCLSLVDCMGM